MNPMVGAIKSRLPWWSKIGAKLVLSRLPAAYAIWQRLGLFRHGYMDTAQYALGVFSSHVERAGLTGRLAGWPAGRLAGKTVLELGPGDSVATALIAKAFGARAILVDAGAFARPDIAAYRPLADALRTAGLAPPPLDNVKTLDDLLAACDASYLTQGLASLRAIADESVDLVFSQAVLEHVRKHEFLETQRALARLLKPDGVCSHRVDLRDHLGGGLNNLRFSERLWESPFFAGAGFYTNRIGFDGMLQAFEQAGFQSQVTEVRRWDRLPIDRRHLADEFRPIPDDVLTVCGFDVVLRRSAGPAAGAQPDA